MAERPDQSGVVMHPLPVGFSLLMIPLSPSSSLSASDTHFPSHLAHRHEAIFLA